MLLTSFRLTFQSRCPHRLTQSFPIALRGSEPPARVVPLVLSCGNHAAAMRG